MPDGVGRRREGVLSGLMGTAGSDHRQRVPHNQRRRVGRACCSTRWIVLSVLAAAAGAWALYVVRRLIFAGKTTPRGDSMLADTGNRLQEPVARDPSLWPDATAPQVADAAKESPPHGANAPVPAPPTVAAAATAAATEAGAPSAAGQDTRGAAAKEDQAAAAGGAATAAAGAAAEDAPPAPQKNAYALHQLEAAVDAPPTPLEDAYALQRLQAAVDADADSSGEPGGGSAGGDWDTGSLGGERARAAVRAALLRDHEAALERDRVEHAEAGGAHAHGEGHSAAHHHDA